MTLLDRVNRRRDPAIVAKQELVFEFFEALESLRHLFHVGYQYRDPMGSSVRVWLGGIGILITVQIWVSFDVESLTVVWDLEDVLRGESIFEGESPWGLFEERFGDWLGNLISECEKKVSDEERTEDGSVDHV